MSERAVFEILPQKASHLLNGENIMKTAEELDALKNEVETLRNKFAELTENETELAAGGTGEYEFEAERYEFRCNIECLRGYLQNKMSKAPYPDRVQIAIGYLDKIY